MKKSILALPLCVAVTTLVYATDASFVNGPMRFMPIKGSAYELNKKIDAKACRTIKINRVVCLV